MFGIGRRFKRATGWRRWSRDEHKAAVTEAHTAAQDKIDRAMEDFGLQQQARENSRLLANLRAALDEEATRTTTVDGNTAIRDYTGSKSKASGYAMLLSKNLRPYTPVTSQPAQAPHTGEAPMTESERQATAANMAQNRQAMNSAVAEARMLSGGGSKDPSRPLTAGLTRPPGGYNPATVHSAYNAAQTNQMSRVSFGRNPASRLNNPDAISAGPASGPQSGGLSPEEHRSLTRGLESGARDRIQNDIEAARRKRLAGTTSDEGGIYAYDNDGKRYSFASAEARRRWLAMNGGR